MADESWEFDEALKTAQELGYAERNPEADVEGYDACRKIAILSSLAFGLNVDYEDIYTEGITKVTSKDIAYAKKLGRAIKLLASSKKEDGKFYAMVAPYMIPKSHPLFSVNDVFNAVFVNGNMVGDVMFYGSGAGKRPTASAVAGDVVDAVKHIGKNILTFWSSEKLVLTDAKDAARQFFVRANGRAADDLTKVEELFGKVEVVQLDGETEEFGFVTEKMSEKSFEEAFSKLTGAVSRIRLEA